MGSKDKMDLVSIAAGTPGQVETFRYQDGGMERHIQDESEARGDHMMVSRVVNWEIEGKADYGLGSWIPADSLLLYISSDNLFVTEGLCYIGGRRLLEGGAELFSSDDPATDTYYVYMKYTFASDEFVYEYSTSTPTDTDLVKHLMLGTADWNTGTKIWSTVVDLRASNTSLGAPATVSGSDAGAIFTVENTGAGDGLLVKNSDAVIGESGTPQQLIIQGDGTKALTIYNGANSVEAVCSAADTLKLQTIAGGDAELIVKTLNGMVVSSGIVSSGEWQGTVIVKAYLGVHDHTAVDEGGDHAWADITGFGTTPPATGTGAAGTSDDVSRADHTHDIGSHDHDSVYYTETEQQDWIKKVHYLHKYATGGVTESTHLNYPCMKYPASSSDWGYWMFRIPETWVNTTNSVIKFVYLAAAAFSGDDADYAVEVSGYKINEMPSATFNIDSGNTGVVAGVSTYWFHVTSSDDIKFDAGDLVMARLGFDGTKNDEIIYIFDAFIEYT